MHLIEESPPLAIPTKRSEAAKRCFLCFALHHLSINNHLFTLHPWLEEHVQTIWKLYRIHCAPCFAVEKTAGHLICLKNYSWSQKWPKKKEFEKDRTICSSMPSLQRLSFRPGAWSKTTPAHSDSSLGAPGGTLALIGKSPNTGEHRIGCVSKPKRPRSRDFEKKMCIYIYITIIMIYDVYIYINNNDNNNNTVMSNHM